MSLEGDYLDDWFCDYCWQDECVCEPITPENCPHNYIELEELSDSLIFEVCQDCGKTFKIVGQFGFLFKENE